MRGKVEESLIPISMSLNIQCSGNQAAVFTYLLHITQEPTKVGALMSVGVPLMFFHPLQIKRDIQDTYLNGIYPLIECWRFFLMPVFQKIELFCFTNHNLPPASAAVSTFPNEMKTNTNEESERCVCIHATFFFKRLRVSSQRSCV